MTDVSRAVYVFMMGLPVCNTLNPAHWLFCSFLHCVESTFVPHLSHLRQQTPQLRGCSFCWGQRMATKNTSPMPCSPSWTKSASGRVRTQNGKRQPGTLLHVATWAWSSQLCEPGSDCMLLSEECCYWTVFLGFYSKLQGNKLISGHNWAAQKGWRSKTSFYKYNYALWCENYMLLFFCASVKRKTSILIVLAFF